MQDATKFCKKCELIKSIDLFGIQDKKTGTRRSYCFLCSAQRSREYRQKQSNNPATKPGTHEDLGDAIYNINGFLGAKSVWNKEKSERYSMPFEGGKFDPDRARLRAAGAI